MLLGIICEGDGQVNGQDLIRLVELSFIIVNGYHRIVYTSQSIVDSKSLKFTWEKITKKLSRYTSWIL